MLVFSLHRVMLISERGTDVMNNCNLRLSLRKNSSRYDGHYYVSIIRKPVSRFMLYFSVQGLGIN